MAIESRYLSFQGLRVHFRVVAPETELRHRVLMLSSPLSTTFNWRKLVPELVQLGCLVVLMDLPGFGEGDCGPAVPQGNEMRAHMAWGVLDELDRSMGGTLSLWHLVAHGTASQTILTMANEYPDSVRSQIHISPVLEGTSLPLARRPKGGPARVDERWYERNILSDGGFRKFSEAMFARPADDYVLEHMRHCLTRPGMRESFLRALQGGPTPEPMRGFCPVLVLLGGRDLLLTDSQRAAISRLLPEAELHVLKSAGHFPMETHSKALRDYLRGWLRYLQ